MADRRILWLAAGVAGIALAGIVAIRMMPMPEVPPAQVPAPAPQMPLLPDVPPVVLDAPGPVGPSAAAVDTGLADTGLEGTGSAGTGDGPASALFEAVWEEAESRLRLRFQRADLAATEDFGRLEAEMATLCRDIGLPLVAAEGWPVQEIVVSFAEQPLPVGVFDPDIMQVFEAYRIEGDDCIWEEF